MKEDLRNQLIKIRNMSLPQFNQFYGYEPGFEPANDYVAEKFDKFKKNPLDWILSLDGDNFSNAINGEKS